MQILQCHKVAVLAVFLNWLEMRCSGNLTKKAFYEILCAQLNPPGKWRARRSLQEKPLLKAEQAAGGQPGWYYTFPAGGEILKVGLSRPGADARVFNRA